jgi:putative transposase
MAIKKDTLDGLLAGRDPQAIFAKDGLLDELKKALAERVLNAEIDDHLVGEAAAGKRNSRNGYLRFPTKPARHSNRKPATDSDLKPAGIPI